MFLHVEIYCTHGNGRRMSECTGQQNHQLSQNWFSYTGSKQVSSSDIAPMGIEYVQAFE